MAALGIGKNKVDATKAKSKWYYELLIENNFESPISITKWVDGQGIREEDYLKSQSLAKAATIITKLQSFYVKMLNRILNVNVTFTNGV